MSDRERNVIAVIGTVACVLMGAVWYALGHPSMVWMVDGIASLFR